MPVKVGEMILTLTWFWGIPQKQKPWSVEQSTNNGVKQIRRRVEINNTTQQSNKTRERGKEDGGDNDDWYGGATLEGRGKRRKATTIGKEAHNY